MTGLAAGCDRRIAALEADCATLRRLVRRAADERLRALAAGGDPVETERRTRLIELLLRRVAEADARLSGALDGSAAPAASPVLM